DGEFRMRAMEQLRGFEQRLGRNAARVQARATEGRRAVEVLPFVDARDAELVLCRADCRRIAGRAATDHDDVEVVSHWVPQFLDISGGALHPPGKIKSAAACGPGPRDNP